MNFKKSILIVTSILFGSNALLQADAESLARYLAMEKREAENPCQILHLAGGQPQALCDVIDSVVNFDKYKSVFRNAVLLSGPAGTGKTIAVQVIVEMIAKLREQAGVVEEDRVEFMRYSGSSLNDGFVNTGANTISSIFAKIKNFTDKKIPVIIFIDEIDAAAESRDRTAHDNKTEKNLLTELLVQLSQHKDNKLLFVFFATNKPENLDPAFVSRVSRIDMPLPDQETCGKIFNFYLDKFTHKLEQEVAGFAEKARKHKFSGRDIEDVVNKAQRRIEKAGGTSLIKEAIDDQIKIMIKNKQELEMERRKADGKRRHSPYYLGEIAFITQILMVVPEVATRLLG